MKQNIHKIICITLLFSSTLLAFEGKVFSVTGNQVTITGEGVAHLKAGQKFAVYNGTAKTGEIVVLQASHTQAKAKVTSGTVAKDAAVRVVVAEEFVESTNGSFLDNGDGTVTDAKTGFIWQKCSLGQNNDATCSGKAKIFNWEDAKIACNNLQLAGREWRLPEKEELKSLIYCSDGTKAEDIEDSGTGRHPHSCGWSGADKYEKKYVRPTIRKNLFPNTGATSHWSSDTYTGRNTKAWDVYFYSGFVAFDGKTLGFYVRCVSIDL